MRRYAAAAAHITWLEYIFRRSYICFGFIIIQLFDISRRLRLPASYRLFCQSMANVTTAPHAIAAADAAARFGRNDDID